MEWVNVDAAPKEKLLIYLHGGGFEMMPINKTWAQLNCGPHLGYLFIADDPMKSRKQGVGRVSNRSIFRKMAPGVASSGKKDSEVLYAWLRYRNAS